jgi:hypothetical protein
MRGVPLLVLAACTDPLTSGLALDRVEPPQGPAGVAMPVALEGAFRLPIVSDLDEGETTVVDGVPTASVGSLSLDNVVWDSDRRITGTVPDTLVAGTYDVTVALGGRSQTLSRGYTAIDTTIAAPFAMTGARWLLPCIPGTNGDPNINACRCDNFTTLFNIDGTAGDRWHVTARIHGVVEYIAYAGGVQGPGDSYLGGFPGDGANNVYALGISSPLSLYYINSNPTLAGGQHNSWPIDYELTFDIDAGATVMFTMAGQDGIQWEGVDANDVEIALSDVSDPPQPYNGQFARLDVISAVAF